MQTFNLDKIRFSYIIIYTKEGGISYDEILSEDS